MRVVRRCVVDLRTDSDDLEANHLRNVLLANAARDGVALTPPPPKAWDAMSAEERARSMAYASRGGGKRRAVNLWPATIGGGILIGTLRDVFGPQGGVFNLTNSVVTIACVVAIVVGLSSLRHLRR